LKNFFKKGEKNRGLPVQCSLSWGRNLNRKRQRSVGRSVGRKKKNIEAADRKAWL